VRPRIIIDSHGAARLRQCDLGDAAQAGAGVAVVGIDRQRGFVQFASRPVRAFDAGEAIELSQQTRQLPMVGDAQPQPQAHPPAIARRFAMDVEHVRVFLRHQRW
jgi:hypothetical protein